MERVQVENVEPSHDGAIKENGADSVERSESSDEGDHTAGPVGAVDANLGCSYRLHVFR
jgi:hypothetical protein